MKKSRIELREENGKLRAFREDGVEISIPAPPTYPDMMNEWLRGLSLDVLDAARQFYFERWNWETGCPKDLELHRLCETALNLRIGVLENRVRMVRAWNERADRTTIDLLRKVEQQQDRSNG